jgi:transcriptional regulator with XRE-family HTH domain
MNESDRARKALGEKLRKAREAAKFTRQEVATAADVRVNFYASFERGKETPRLRSYRVS